VERTHTERQPISRKSLLNCRDQKPIPSQNILSSCAASDRAAAIRFVPFIDDTPSPPQPSPRGGGTEDSMRKAVLRNG
ncbi:hypothetical protein, partial [Nonomuraea sp. NPDC002799]